MKDLFEIKSRFASRIVNNELILVPLRKNVSNMNELFIVDEVGCFIWEQITENACKKDIITALVSRYDVVEYVAEKDVSEFIDRLDNILNK